VVAVRKLGDVTPRRRLPRDLAQEVERLSDVLLHLAALLARERAARDAQELELRRIEQRTLTVEVAVRQRPQRVEHVPQLHRDHARFVGMFDLGQECAQLGAEVVVGRLLDREQEAQTDRVDAAVGKLFGFCRRCTRDRDLAESCSSDA